MEAVVFVFSLLDCCALIFLSVYFIITLSDLECDYINARSCCSKLNKWVIPELVGHTLVTVLMLISLHWFIFLLNLPVAAWNIYRNTQSRAAEVTHERSYDQTWFPPALFLHVSLQLEVLTDVLYVREVRSNGAT
uniref:Cornichon family AMPA receptor auxiliary protein 4 n=1 Tax=Moschus moschiferus TaxID=68415 RepID=A0A8C6E7T2_MOSMO